MTSPGLGAWKPVPAAGRGQGGDMAVKRADLVMLTLALTLTLTLTLTPGDGEPGQGKGEGEGGGDLGGRGAHV